MRKTLTVAGLAVVMLAAPAFVPTASADPNWFVGAGFRIGPIAFSLVLGSPHRGPEAYYWRTSQRFAYRGARCSDACFLDHGVYYHASTCPLVHRHLDRYGYDTRAVFTRYAPRYYDYGYRDRRDRGHYRYDRYDDRRTDEHWRDRRYRDRDRYDDRGGRDRHRRDDRRHRH
jgi:hypothetical protein